MTADEGSPDYRIFFEGAGEGMVFTGADERVTGANPEACRLLRGELGELLGLSLEEFFDPSYPFLRVAREAASGADPGASFRGAVRLRRLDGSAFPAELSILRASAGEGREPGWVLIFRETAYEGSAEEIKDQQYHFTALVENGLDLMALCDPDNTIRYVSPSVRRILGYEPEELVGVFVPDLLHTEDLDYAIRESARIMADPEHKPSPVRYRRKDGSYAYLETVFKNMLDDPAVRAIVCNSRDVTERVWMEEELRKSEARYRSVVETAQDAIVTMDHDGLIRFMNPAAQSLFGYDPEEVLEGPLARLISSRFRQTYEEELERYLQPEQPYTSGRTVELAGERKDGEEFQLELTLGVSTHEAEPLFTGIIRDITESKALEAQLEHQAFNDPLTNLPNRALFMDRLSHALVRSSHERAHRQNGEDRTVAVLLLDLDRFKIINDSYGHEAGDRVLAEVGRRLRASLPPQHTVARFGGDEFAILLEDLSEAQEALRTAERLADALGLTFQAEGQGDSISASIGAASSGQEDGSPTELLRNADIAMYRAKRGGGSRCEFYTPAMGAEAARCLELESDLRHAVEREELRLHYQPIIDFSTGRVAGMEALLRWEHPIHGLMLPEEFIPIAEESGMIVAIGRWALREACLQARVWRERDPGHAPMVSVNVSPKQFQHSGLIGEIRRTLAEARLDPASLTIELTESCLVEETQSAAEVLRELKSFGVRVAIDDFGTGYSSLGRLEQLPLDIFKIDRSFIGKLEGGPTETAIVEAIVGLGRGLGMEVIAEGIETAEHSNQARILGCDGGQGYYFCRPVPAQEAGELLFRRFKPLPEELSGAHQA